MTARPCAGRWRKIHSMSASERSPQISKGLRASIFRWILCIYVCTCFVAMAEQLPRCRFYLRPNT